MNRREFLKIAAPAAAASATACDRVSSRNRALPGTNFEGGASVRPGDAEAYFTDLKLRELVGRDTPRLDSSFEVFAFNFPSWHPSPYMEQVMGPGWTEYETLKASRPLFPGHLFPKYPLWGYFNEADPEWAEREIEAASGHGLDGWMIDWYWHDGTMFYHEQLEEGFLRAANRSELKFAIMWANHDWLNVYPASSPGSAEMLLPQNHSEEDTMRALEYMIEHYFSQPNYWRINGGLVLGVFSFDRLIAEIPFDRLQALIDQIRERIAAVGLGELHLQAVGNYGELDGRLREVGIDSAAPYNCLAWTYRGRAAGERTPYGVGCSESVEIWRDLRDQSNVPFIPTCTVGWDDSPRFGEGAHVATQRTPDQFERLMIAAQHFLAESERPIPEIVYLNAWNEWTEDCVLLPDTFYGYSYLEAVRRAFPDVGTALRL